LLSNIFGSKRGIVSNNFTNLVKEIFNSYNNLNFYIKRNDSFFRTSGRLESSVDAAKEIDILIKNELDNNFNYMEINNDVNEIIQSDLFLNALKESKNGSI
jgi:hypothetical protein